MMDYYKKVFNLDAEVMEPFLAFMNEKVKSPNESSTIVQAVLLPAIEHQFVEVVEYILQRRPNVNEILSDNSTLLHVAVAKKSVDITRMLLENNANLEALEMSKRTPLFQAVVLENTEQVQTLLRFGADVNTKDMFNRTLLNVLCSRPKVNIGLCKVLLEAGCAPNNLDGKGATALQTLVVNMEATDVFECAELLIKHGASLTSRTNGLDTVLHLAVIMGRPDLTQLFLEHGADKDALNDIGETPLFNTIPEPCDKHKFPSLLKCADLLVKAGANVNIQSSEGYTVLHVVAHFVFDINGKVSMLEFLLRNGADPKITNKSNETFMDVVADENTPFRQLILRKLIIKDVQKKFQSGLDMLSSKESDIKYEKACREELKNLMNLSETFSVIDVMTSSKRRVANFCRNGELRRIMFDLEDEKYPIYGNELRRFYLSGLRRCQAEKYGRDFFSIFSRGFLDAFSVKEILKYLPTKNLEKFECFSIDEDELTNPYDTNI